MSSPLPSPHSKSRDDNAEVKAQHGDADRGLSASQADITGRAAAVGYWTAWWDDTVWSEHWSHRFVAKDH